MCCRSVIEFGTKVIEPTHAAGLRVLEVGSFDVNGSLRPRVEAMRPASYLGVDMRPGPRVDAVRDACSPDFCASVRAPFGLVISTEMLEHAQDWRAAVSNLKGCVADGGRLLITTRSLGFPLHGYPSDYWRFEVDDMRAIFSDMEILALESDWQAPGVHMYARRRPGPAADLAGVSLHSMLAGRRAP